MYASLRGFVQRTVRKTTPEKDVVRKETIDLVLNHFSKKKVTGINFLTLPSSQWRFERAISKCVATNPKLGMDLHFTGCERDWQLYSFGCINMAPFAGETGIVTAHCEEVNCQISATTTHAFFHCDIFDYMEKMPMKKFECVWLDTMTTIAAIDERLKSIANVVEKGSMVILTIIKAREHKKLPMERLDYVNSLMCPMGMKLVKTWEYSDTSPMLQVAYLKTRK